MTTIYHDIVLDGLSVEQLSDLKAPLIEARRQAQADLEIINTVYNAKVLQLHVDEATTQIRKYAEANNIDPDTAANIWLDSGQPGRVVQANLYLGLPRIAYTEDGQKVDIAERRRSQAEADAARIADQENE